MYWALIHATLEPLLGLLSPPRCSACGQRLPGSTVFCEPCAATVLSAGHSQRSSPHSTVQVVAFSLYGGAMADAIRHLKYGDRPDLARPLGDLAGQAARRAGLAADLVVPVPLHPSRLAERGFNQAALIARVVAPRVGGRHSPRALQRTRVTAPQASLQRSARAANVATAFRVRRPGQVHRRRVLLVDDVVTTGATLSSCAKVLRDAGAEGVEALVVARASGDER